LRVEAKPRPGLDILESRAAGRRFENAKDAWGERGWAAVARLCRFHAALGMALPFECPPPIEASGEDPET